MEYCSSIFSSSAKTHLKKLDVIQRKAARIIYDAHTDILLLFLKLDELEDRREAHLVKLFKAFLSGKCHPAMPSMVEASSDKTLTSPGLLLAHDDLLFSVTTSTTSIWVSALMVRKQTLSHWSKSQRYKEL